MDIIEITIQVEHLIDLALEEDAAFNDVTTKALVAQDIQGIGILRSKESGILAGIDVALAAFRRFAPSLKTKILLHDGVRIYHGDALGEVEGSVANILSAERTALNFLQRMSGISTETSLYVNAVKGLETRIFDTRKTVPGFRYLDKYAVRMGGGHNHRSSLAESILIKDNHISLFSDSQASGDESTNLDTVIKLVRNKLGDGLKIEVEVTTLMEVRNILDILPDIIMLDNMSVDDIREAVNIVSGKALVEASGGMTLDIVRAVAEAGVNIISVGSLTHSPKALDISLDLVSK